MKFLEFRRDSEPLDMLELLLEKFIPDINSALRKNPRFEVNQDDPLSEMDIVALFSSITNTLSLVYKFCNLKYKEVPASIRAEMKILDGCFVWFRFVPLNKNGEPITKEKENFSLVLPSDQTYIDALNKDGYNVIILFRKFFRPRN